jgi:hypothetical protein
MPRFQFSMRWMLVTITVICILLFLWVSFGSFVGAIYSSVVWCVIPTPLVIVAIYGRGDMQCFAIGAVIPWVILLASDTPFYGPYSILIWLPIMMALCGFVAVATRRWIRLD